MSKPLICTVLGSGSSSGTPVIGCSCSVCTGTNPKNIRSRCSAWIQCNNAHLIIDTGVDFRFQALREKIPRVDAVLYTHAHADHLNGIDDLRAFCFAQKSAIDIYANADTLANISDRFDYTMLPPNRHWNRPILTPHLLPDGPTNICGIDIDSFDVPHGRIFSRAYRIGNIAWLTDISALDNTLLPRLKNLDYLFIDCLMERSYPSHLSLAQAIEYAQAIGAQHTFLIHMTHNLNYDTLICPPNIAPAYDGLRIYSTGSLS